MEKQLYFKKEHKAIPFIVILQTVFVAIFCDIKSLNYALTYGGYIAEGAMNLLYPLVIACIFLVSLIKKNFAIRKFYPYALFLLFYLILFYIITFCFVGPPYASVSFFAVFVICAFLIPQVSNINVKLMVKLIMCLPFFAVLRLNDIFGINQIYLNEISMDASYAFLLPIISNIVYIKFYFKEEKFLSKLITIAFSIINSIFLGYVLIFGSRGPIICIIALLFFWFIFKKRINQQGVYIQRKRFFVIISFILFFYLFGEFIISWLVSILESYGISITALNKMVSLRDSGDVSNGRNELYIWAISGFFESPFIGYGMDRFDARYPGASYPHNFILQTLYDGGLLLFFILFYPLCIRLKRYIKNITYDEYVVFSMFFFTSVPGALFSQDLWSNAVLWLTFGLLFSERFTVAK